MQASRVTSNAILILTSEIIDRAMRFLLVIVAARLLGDQDFGKFSFAINFGSLFLIFADFGLNQLLIREIAKNPSEVKRFIGNGLVLKIALSVLAFLCIYIAAQFTQKPAIVLKTVYVIAACLIVGSFADFFSTVFQGFQRMKYEVIGSLILSISNTLFGIAILVLGGGIFQLAWIYLASRFLRFLFSVCVVRFKFTPIRLSFEKKRIRYFIKEGASFGISRFFSMMYTYVDTTMLSLMIGDAVVGWYNAAYRLIFAMMLVPMGITRAIYPALSSHHTSDPEAFKNLFERAFKVTFIAGTSMATFLFVLSDEVILLLFGEEYIQASTALRILVWSTAIYSIGTIMTHTTRSAGKQAFTAKVVAASAVLNLVLNFVLIPKYSLIGAAFATVMAESFTFVFHFWFMSRYMVKPPFFNLLPKIALLNLGTFLLLQLVIDFPLPIIFALVIPAQALLLFLLRFFSRDELAGIVNLTKSVRRFKRA